MLILNAYFMKAKTEILQERESHKGELSKRKSVLSISSLEDMSFVSAQVLSNMFPVL